MNSEGTTSTKDETGEQHGKYKIPSKMQLIYIYL